MPTLTEALYPCAPIVSEAHGFRSRSTATIPAATEIRVGMVLGKITAGGHVPLAPAATDGSQKAAAVALYPLAATASGPRQIAVFDMDGELRASDLEWPAGISANDKATAVTQLLALGIKLR
jgi:hypothetical protein